MKTGNTGGCRFCVVQAPVASMEPGHEDREYGTLALTAERELSASMEPGHEDREYAEHLGRAKVPHTASMEPGHEDREYHL